MDRYSNEKNIEICAVKLNISLRTIIIVTVCRSPTGNRDYFLNNLEEALNHTQGVPGGMDKTSGECSLG